MSASKRRAAYGPNPGDLHYNSWKFTGGALATETDTAVDPLPTTGGPSGAGMLPASGKYVTIRAIGGDIEFAFTRNAAGTIDRAVAATRAGASGGVGMRILSGEEKDVELPYFTRANPLYFVRESSAVGTHCIITISDEPQNLN